MSPRPRRLVTVLGDVTGRRRRVECQGCDGRADGNAVLSPIALASGRDGALYVGDYNYIRRLSPGRDDIASILQLR
jgi:teneurin